MAITTVKVYDKFKLKPVKKNSRDIKGCLLQKIVNAFGVLSI